MDEIITCDDLIKAVYCECFRRCTSKTKSRSAVVFGFELSKGHFKNESFNCLFVVTVFSR